MNEVISRLRSGRAVVLDDALGAATAQGIRQESIHLLASGRLRPDEVHLSSDFQSVLATRPGLWDSLRITTLVGDLVRAPVLAHAVKSLAALARGLSAAEQRFEMSLSPAWPALGLANVPVALLAVSGFNGTRYAPHVDSQSQPERKVTLTYYPAWWAHGVGGALRILEGPRRNERVIEPRADRLVVFDSDWPHEVLPARRPRLSLTMWGLGLGGRLWPPPEREEADALHCTSAFCQLAVAHLR